MVSYFSAFTGAMGFDLGVPEDWKCVGTSEIDKNANKLIRYRLKVKNYGDIEKINYKELPDFDVLIGGSPCQDLSIAGKRKGLAGLRSRLFFSYIAILKSKKPEYFIFENVKGLLSSNGGRDFARVLLEFSEAGYDIAWQLLDAGWFGIPQHRERVFICGTTRKGGIREVLFKPGSGEENIELQGQSCNTLTKRYRGGEATGSYIVESKFNAQIETVKESKNEAYRVYGTGGIAPALHRKTGGYQVTKIAMPVADVTHGIARQQGRRIKNAGEPSFTLQKSQRQGVMEDSKIRYLTPLECERLMGWPDNWTKYGMEEDGRVVELSDNARYNLTGNGVVPQIVKAIIKAYGIMEL